MCLGELEVGMKEEILMSDANLGSLRTEQEVSQTAENLIEVDNDVGTTFLDIFIDTMDTGNILWSFDDVIT